MDYLLEGQETKRLMFRKLVRTDFDDWLPFHQDPRSSGHWTSGDLNPKVACENWFHATFNRYSKKLGGMNVLMDKELKTLIGQCGLLVQTVDGIQELEIGYSILPFYWNQGYATEAALKCMEHAFQHKLSQTLISIIHINNTASQEVAKKIGMSLNKTTSYKANPVHIYRINLPPYL